METHLYPSNKNRGYSGFISCWRKGFLLLGLWSYLASGALGQAKVWDKTYGGELTETLNALQQTSDGGYILGGSSESDSSGNKTGASLGGYDFWVVKLDSAGNKQWDKTFGSPEGDYLAALQQTSDGGYILGGTSEADSSSGDNFWIVKLDATGNKVWDKTYGGSKNEILAALQQTPDGGYLLAGFSDSDISGDKTQASQEESYDYWVLKLDAAGNKQYDKTYGGSNLDILTSLQQTSDGGCILGGYSNSGISGDKTEGQRGGAEDEDFWVVKLDAAGNKQWDKTYGGILIETLNALLQTSDGGYLLGGTSASDISGDKTEGNRGDCDVEGNCPNDYWIVKLDAAGNKAWDKTYGGSKYEDLLSLQQTAEGGYILGGSANSRISGDKTEDSRGDFDYWIVKLDAAGNKAWDRTFGGSNFDFFTEVRQTRDGGYILGGGSDSDISGDKSEPRRALCDTVFCTPDFWLVKIKGEVSPLPPLIRSFLPQKDVPGALVTIRGQNLSGTTSVRFNGLEAAFEVVSAQEVRATVPVAATSGKITLVTADGTTTSPGSFGVRHPRILTFAPDSGAVGTTVSLTGDRFTTATEVYFGGVKALGFQVLTDTTMTAVVPDSATTGRIMVVLAGGGFGNSKTKFIVTPPAPAISGKPLADSKPARKAIPAGITTPIAVPGVAVYPNPFHRQVTISFSLAQPQPVVVKVYDLLGREVGLLYQGDVRAHQAYQVSWQPEAQLSGGLYLIRLQAPGQLIQRKILLTR